jgi:hypothetical protein
MPKTLIYDHATGETIERELTAEEIAELEALGQLPIEAQIQQVEASRKNAYREEADPLFFGWQRGENTEQAWLDKVAEIRARFPYAE